MAKEYLSNAIISRAKNRCKEKEISGIKNA
jgi:hypothetical protein